MPSVNPEEFPGGASQPPKERPIEPNRRLIKPGFDESITEYIDTDLGMRVIAIRADSEQAEIHEHLQREGLPVYLADYEETRLRLFVPDGTRLLRRQLRFIARDIPNYGQIFSNLGSLLMRIYDSGVGLPEAYPARPLLDSFAYSDDSNIYGGKMFLTPPYKLNDHISINQVLGQINTELYRADVFESTEVEGLMERIEQGWIDESRL